MARSAYITPGNAPEVVRGAQGGAGLPVSVGFETLPPSGRGLRAGAIAVLGNLPGDLWAVGTGVFHRTVP